MIHTMPVKFLPVWTMEELSSALRMRALGVPVWNIAKLLGREPEDVRSVVG